MNGVVMKSLIIAEKPSVALDIVRALKEYNFVSHKGYWESADVIVTHAIGHLIRLDSEPQVDQSGRPGRDLPVFPLFKTFVIEKTKDQYGIIEGLLRRKDIGCVVNACDAGREGELIFRLILQHANSKHPIERMWMQSMTEEGIREAWRGRRPGAEYEGLKDAAYSRSEADWLVGINFSRGASRLLRKRATVGRVQTPVLAMVVDRVAEIENFVPRSYFEVRGTFRVQAGEYVGILHRDSGAVQFDTKEEAQKVADACLGKWATITDIEKQEKKRPPLLYDLTGLQKECSVKFSYSPKKTLDIAQALYEKHKMITYPRTDSTALPEDYAEKCTLAFQSLRSLDYVRAFIDKIFQNNMINPKNKRIFNNKKISDHFAIIPTGTIVNLGTEEEKNVYSLILMRFIASFYPDATILRTVRTSAVEGHAFRTSGSVVQVYGWMEVLGTRVEEEEKGEGSGDSGGALCPVSPGESGEVIDVAPVGCQTKPPKYYTDATLLAAMETAGKDIEDEELRSAMKEKGLGTPATRAVILDGLFAARKGASGAGREPYLDRKQKSNKAIVPTQEGVELIRALRDAGIHDIISPEVTAQWEHRLKQIERREYTRDDFIKRIKGFIQRYIDVMLGKVMERQADNTGIPCVRKDGEYLDYNKFLKCPTCGHVIWKTIANKTLTLDDIKALVNGDVLGPFDFMNKKGVRFSANLAIQEDNIKFIFENKTDDITNIPCPKCQEHLIETQKSYKCRGCNFLVWKKYCGREFSQDEVAQLLRGEVLGPVRGFTSKTGRSFAAKVRMEDGGYALVFQE
jgi:DNA topoisomerase-3